MYEAIKKEKKNMKFKTLSMSPYVLCVLLFSSTGTRGLWLPPLFFEDLQANTKKEETVPATIVADTGVGKTHFIVGSEPGTSKSAPVSQSTPKAVVLDGIPLNCDGHVCTVLFDKLYETLEILIAREKKKISVAAYMLTDKRIAQWLADAQARGVVVEVVTDLSCLRERSNKLGDLYESGIPVFICMPERKGAKSSLMHNKFILFESNIYGKKIIWTGSANLTRSAFNEIHHENVVVFEDNAAYREYENKFASLKKRSEPYEDCTITNAALHEKIRTSNNTLKKGQSDKKTRKAI